jgi:DNA-binding YbaB/EbfC family protein
MDPRKMMKQMAKMQADLAKAQEELAEATVEGTAGGGVVKVVLSGAGDVVDIDIDPQAADPDDPSLLEDLVMAAFNDALRAQKELTEERLGGLTAGLNIPGLT